MAFYTNYDGITKKWLQENLKNLLFACDFLNASNETHKKKKFFNFPEADKCNLCKNFLTILKIMPF